MRDRNLVLSQYAHHHRQHPTHSEELLWYALRARQLGVQFRRQVVLLGFIVDFCAPQARLVIEVDGEYHENRRRADARRDRRLVRAGHRVLRIIASMVVDDLPRVIEMVAEASRRTERE